jgi:hypothetical protein
LLTTLSFSPGYNAGYWCGSPFECTTWCAGDITAGEIWRGDEIASRFPLPSLLGALGPSLSADLTQISVSRQGHIVQSICASSCLALSR